jgi:hypothetical protein
MSAVIFKTHNAVFTFNQNDVKELVARKKSEYDLDEVAKLLEAISADNIETIEIPEEPVYFDNIALDLIAAGNGSILCKTCNKTYVARQLKPIKVGFDGSPLEIQREKRGVFKRLFEKRRKPPTMSGGKGYECPAGHDLISVITWKTF